jgi:outer membrane protein
MTNIRAEARALPGSLLAVTAAAIAVAGALFAAQPAHAEKQAGDILVRGRALLIAPDTDSSLSNGGAHIAGSADVDNAVIPELDLSYFFTDHIAAELILGTSKHDVSARNTPLGNLDLGSIWLLPPTLTAQYHFNPHGKISPYVGAGVNYTIFYNADDGDAQHIKYDNSFGYAFQVGVDYALTDNWSLNFDVKKLFLSTTATIDAGLAAPVKADVDIDPWLVGVGFGYRF